MLFNSVGFLFGFLPITYLVFWRLSTRHARYVWLTLTGYVFYSFWNYKFCALMLFSTLVSYVAGLGLLRWDAEPSKRRICLIAPVVADLCLLGYFKYAGLLMSTVQTAADLWGIRAAVPVLDITLPIGISFYTFHTISYVVDGYKRTIKPTRNFFEFACYVSLFCQLVAGPIVRFRQIEQDLDALGVADRWRYWERGWSFFVLGMLKKVLLADTLAAVVDPALANYDGLSSLSVWLVMLGYTCQLYFDFSGYSDMAVGLGYLFGLRIPQNFDSPYKAVDPSDFWRRWHISLSTCLRDYVYIPLGGNRHASYRNLFLTMLIGGLWHGASWTFVTWGAYHGLLLVAYKRFGSSWDALPIVLRRGAMFLAVVVGWVFFRSHSFGMAGTLLRRMFWPTSGHAPVAATTLVLALIVALLVVHSAPNTWQLAHKWRPVAALALTAGFVATLLATYGSHLSPFLYFQF
jgi:alginate O-acetyltransferase complex protein AlgI